MTQNREKQKSSKLCALCRTKLTHLSLDEISFFMLIICDDGVEFMWQYWSKTWELFYSAHWNPDLTANLQGTNTNKACDSTHPSRTARPHEPTHSFTTQVFVQWSKSTSLSVEKHNSPLYPQLEPFPLKGQLDRRTFLSSQLVSCNKNNNLLKTKCNVKYVLRSRFLKPSETVDYISLFFLACFYSKTFGKCRAAFEWRCHSFVK